jgi:hypothetical protein
VDIRTPVVEVREREAVVEALAEVCVGAWEFDTVGFAAVLDAVVLDAVDLCATVLDTVALRAVAFDVVAFDLPDFAAADVRGCAGVA